MSENAFDGLATGQMNKTQEKHVFSNRKEVRQEILEMAAKMPDKDKPLSISEKVARISATIKELKRTGKNADQGYKYLKIEDVVNAIRPALEAHKLSLTGRLNQVQTIPDAKGITFQVLMDWIIEDLETGEVRSWTVPGTGWDYHDKGIYKAITGSRKYAHIIIFNLPIGDNPETAAGQDRETAKAAQKNVAASKLADAAGRGNQTAIDQLSQIETEKKIIVSRPEEANGHYIAVSGFLAAPPLERFFDDTNSKRFKSKADGTPYWRVPSDYEKGLIALCNKLGIEVEG